MAKAKRGKLAMARKHLAAVSHELEERMTHDSPIGAEELSSTISSWATYQRLVKEAPTWPFNAGIIRKLLMSTIVPAVVYMIKILAGLGFRF
jgi:hypothetical protein